MSAIALARSSSTTTSTSTSPKIEYHGFKTAPRATSGHTPSNTASIQRRPTLEDDVQDALRDRVGSSGSSAEAKHGDDVWQNRLLSRRNTEDDFSYDYSVHFPGSYESDDGAPIHNVHNPRTRVDDDGPSQSQDTSRHPSSGNEPSAAATAKGSTGPGETWASRNAGRPQFEVLRDDHAINVDEEVRLYEELCRVYDEEARSFDQRSQSFTNIPLPSNARQDGAESLFSSGDIYISDNRETSGFAKGVEISGWTTVAGDRVPSLQKGKSMTGIGSGAYVVYDCVVTTKENTTFHMLKRYSAFEDLEWALRRSLPPALLPALPSLPPKAPFARFRPAFLDRRRQHLQFWLARVILHPEIGATEAVKRWVMM